MALARKRQEGTEMKMLVLVSLMAIAGIIAMPAAEAACLGPAACAPNAPPECRTVASTYNTVADEVNRVICP